MCNKEVRHDLLRISLVRRPKGGQINYRGLHDAPNHPR